VISPHPLDRLVEQAAFAEMLALLEPEELVIASLRLEDLSDDQIASLLDIDRATVRYRMEQARQRIVETLPEMASVLNNRRHAPARDPRPLERGWLCPSIDGEPDSLASRPLDPERQVSGPRLPGQVEKRELSSDSSPVFALPG
jgi:predicted DNA-binding protein (UPF0251 family)